MLTELYPEVIIEPKLTTPTFVVANLAAQPVKVTIGNDDPAEIIDVIVQFTVNALTGFVADGYLNILRKAQLICVDDEGTHYPLDLSGAAAVEMVAAEALKNDASTIGAVRMMNNGSVRATSIVRICYRFNLTHPMVTDTMRLRTVLPCHLFNQPSILSLDFGAAADISGVGDPITAFSAEVVVWRRRMTPEWKALGADSLAYFIRSSLTEVSQGIDASILVSTERRVTLQSNGRASGFLFRFFKGNATLTRATFDGETTAGQETIWKIQQNKKDKERFRLKHLQIANQFYKANATDPAGLNLLDAIGNISLAGLLSVNPPLWVTAKTILTAAEGAGSLSTGLLVQDPASVYLDKGGARGLEIYEPGAFMNVTLPAGQLTELVGNVITPANQPSQIKVTARVYDEKIDQFKKS